MKAAEQGGAWLGLQQLLCRFWCLLTGKYESTLEYNGGERLPPKCVYR